MSPPSHCSGDQITILSLSQVSALHPHTGSRGQHHTLSLFLGVSTTPSHCLEVSTPTLSLPGGGGSTPHPLTVWGLASPSSHYLGGQHPPSHCIGGHHPTLSLSRRSVPHPLTVRVSTPHSSLSGGQHPHPPTFWGSSPSLLSVSLSWGVNSVDPQDSERVGVLMPREWEGGVLNPPRRWVLSVKWGCWEWESGMLNPLRQWKGGGADP